MTSPKSDFEEKEYEDLTETQQGIVDLLTEDPSLTDEEIAEEVGCSDSYVYAARRGADELIEEIQEEDELDEFFKEVEAPGEETSADGEEETVIERGNVTVLGEIENTSQFWDERPHQNQLSQEQLDYIEGLPIPEYYKRLIRFKTRNPDATTEEVAEALDLATTTIYTYISECRDHIEEVHSLAVEADIEEEEPEIAITEPTGYEEPVEAVETNGDIEVLLSTDNVIDIMSSDTTREVKERIVEELVG